eukprot:g30783.t1
MQILPLQCWREKCQSATSRGRRRRSATEGEVKLMMRTETFGDFWNFTLNPTGHFRNFRFCRRCGRASGLLLGLRFDPLLLHRTQKTWFLPDFTVTLLDIILEFSDGSQTDRISTRVLRLLRLFRVVRLGKVTRFASFLRDKFESEVAYTQFSLLLLVIGMMLQEHVIACGWFGIASLGTHPTSWLSEHGRTSSSFTLQYTDSLRWSFSQLGVGGTEIEAMNETEGIYSVVVSLISLMTFSSIISSMTSLVSTLQSRRIDQTQQFGLLRRFLKTNHIEENLSQRITRFLHYTYHQRTANVEDPYILDYLSKSLQADLQLARYKAECNVVRSIAREAVSVHEVAEDDVVFCHGNKAISAYYMIRGSLLYLQMGCTARSPPAAWIAEMSLWTEWTHQGDRPGGSTRGDRGRVRGFRDMRLERKDGLVPTRERPERKNPISMHLE